MAILDSWRTMATHEQVSVSDRIKFRFKLTCANFATIDDVRSAIVGAGLSPGGIDAPGLMESTFLHWEVEFPGYVGSVQSLVLAMSNAIARLNATLTVPCLGYDAGEVQVFVPGELPGPVSGFSAGILVAVVLIAFVVWKVK